MKITKDKLAVLDKINFKKTPVGIKFNYFKPENIKQLNMEKELSLCEMIKEAQENEDPFYFSAENEETCVGKILLGMEDMADFAESGQIGERLGVFAESRANYSLYKDISTFKRGIVNYVSFAPLAKIDFNPDVLILSATTSQAEVIMRAASYSTGIKYTSQTTPVMGCSWLLIYPYQSGNINYLLPGMVHGMKGRKVFPEGTILISIPYQWLITVLDNLKDMEINLPTYESREKYDAEFEEILTDLAQKSHNH